MITVRNFKCYTDENDQGNRLLLLWEIKDYRNNESGFIWKVFKSGGFQSIFKQICQYAGDIGYTMIWDREDVSAEEFISRGRYSLLNPVLCSGTIPELDVLEFWGYTDTSKNSELWRTISSLPDFTLSREGIITNIVLADVTFSKVIAALEVAQKIREYYHFCQMRASHSLSYSDLVYTLSKLSLTGFPALEEAINSIPHLDHPSETFE